MNAAHSRAPAPCTLCTLLQLGDLAKVVPSALTFSALVCGLSSVRAAGQGNFGLSERGRLALAGLGEISHLISLLYGASA